MNADTRTVAEVIEAVARGSSTVVGQVRRSAEAELRHRRLRAFTQVDTEAAFDAAERLDHCGERPELPLRGVVLAVKDNIDTAGFATTAGTPALRTHRPPLDAPAVRVLREAGAVVLGKTNMHELALGVTSDNATFGLVGNPVRPDRIAGGSSGGSAAAVAAGVVTAALGTETGCSVRLPAALCGLVGFRPTVGAYRTEGVVTVSWTRDTVGVLARSVDDVRVLDAVIRCSPGTPAAGRGPGLRGVRLASPRPTFRQGMTSALRAAFEARLAVLEEAGARIVESDLPDGTWEVSGKCGLPILLYETSRGVDRYLATHATSLRFHDVAARVAGSDVAELVRGLAGGGTEDAYAAALDQGAHLDRLLRGYLEDHRLDGIVVPTTPIPAPRPAVFNESTDRYWATFQTLARNTHASSILGWPAISLPAGRDDEGLPFGIDLQFPPGTDSALLAVARACEQTWRDAGRRPRTNDEGEDL
ncbi:amidase family protein [Streptomyces rectiverticillatus]|uniref:amidase family protein n=1 Tax=Streptomyces rectiverticillatus TaxID=173860 RepID=UPI0015C3F581|nr:amidase family protein [Streptomyces rectiverticillatus]